MPQIPGKNHRPALPVKVGHALGRDAHGTGASDDAARAGTGNQVENLAGRPARPGLDLGQYHGRNQAQDAAAING